MEVSSVTSRPPRQERTDWADKDVARQAATFIHGHFREPVRMEDLCRATAAGTRTLQRGFKRSFGVTVTDYLKNVRLNAAYRDLTAADPSRDTVTAIALRNGCLHLGRFSSEFRERFGQLPSDTLQTLAETDVGHAPQALQPVCDTHRTNRQPAAAFRV